MSINQREYDKPMPGGVNWPNVKPAATHTPTPWYLDTLGGNTVWSAAGHGCVAECHKADTQLRDAAFIVRACNSHGDLVAALQWIVENDGLCLGDYPHRLAEARAALAKAGAA